jgi:hypothetical protein
MDEAQVKEQLSAAVKAYTELADKAAAEGTEAPAVFSDKAEITRTEVLTVVDAMLTELDLDVFEIQIWRSMRWRKSNDE